MFVFTHQLFFAERNKRARVQQFWMQSVPKHLKTGIVVDISVDKTATERTTVENDIAH